MFAHRHFPKYHVKLLKHLTGNSQKKTDITKIFLNISKNLFLFCFYNYNYYFFHWTEGVDEDTICKIAALMLLWYEIYFSSENPFLQMNCFRYRTEPYFKKMAKNTHCSAKKAWNILNILWEDWMVSKYLIAP